MWKDLSIQQKSEVMKMAISQGLTDLNEIKKMYDASIPNIEASSVNNTYSSVPYNPSPKDVRYAYGGPLGNIYKGTGNKSQKLSKAERENRAMWAKGQPFYKEMRLWDTGLSDVALAGILGNMGLESGFIPTASNGTHHGYLQNENSIRDYIVKYYGGYGHKQQMQYLQDGLRGKLRGGNTSMGKQLQRRFNNYTSAVKNVTDPIKASQLWEKYYEISGGQAMGARQRYAKHFYDQISASGPGAFRRAKLDGTFSPIKDEKHTAYEPSINVEAPVFHTAANDLQWQPPVVASSRQEDIAPLLVQDNKPLIVEPLEDTSPTPKDFSAIWDQIFPNIENTQEEFNPLLDPSTQFTALQSRPRYQMKPTPIINMPVSNGGNDYMLFKPLAKGGNLFEDGSYLRNYQWLTMPQTDTTYTDYETGLPIQAGQKVWADAQGNLVTVETPNALEDYAAQYKPNASFYGPILDQVNVTGTANPNKPMPAQPDAFAERYAQLLAAPIASNTDVDKVFEEQAQWQYEQSKEKHDMDVRAADRKAYQLTPGFGTFVAAPLAATLAPILGYEAIAAAPALYSWLTGTTAGQGLVASTLGGEAVETLSKLAGYNGFGDMMTKNAGWGTEFGWSFANPGYYLSPSRAAIDTASRVAADALGNVKIANPLMESLKATMGDYSRNMFGIDTNMLANNLSTIAHNYELLPDVAARYGRGWKNNLKKKYKRLSEELPNYSSWDDPYRKFVEKIKIPGTGSIEMTGEATYAAHTGKLKFSPEIGSSFPIEGGGQLSVSTATPSSALSDNALNTLYTLEKDSSHTGTALTQDGNKLLIVKNYLGDTEEAVPTTNAFVINPDAFGTPLYGRDSFRFSMDASSGTPRLEGSLYPLKVSQDSKYASQRLRPFSNDLSNLYMETEQSMKGTILEEGSPVRTAARTYVEDLESRIGDLGTVEGSYRAVAQGLPHSPNDVEILVPESKVGELSKRLNVTRTEPKHNGFGLDVYSDEFSHLPSGKAEFEVLKNGPKGKAVGKNAWQLYEYLYPEEARTLSEKYVESIGKKKYVKGMEYTQQELPMTAEELFDTYRNSDLADIKFLVDTVGAKRNKYIERRLHFLLEGDPKIYREAFIRKLKSVLPEAKILEEQGIHIDYTNVEANKVLLDRLKIDPKYASNPEVMQNIIEHYVATKTIGRRGISYINDGTYASFKAMSPKQRMQASRLQNVDAGGGNSSGGGVNMTNTSGVTADMSQPAFKRELEMVKQFPLTFHPEKIKTAEDVVNQLDRFSNIPQDINRKIDQANHLGSEDIVQKIAEENDLPIFLGDIYSNESGQYLGGLDREGIDTSFRFTADDPTLAFEPPGDFLLLSATKKPDDFKLSKEYVDKKFRPYMEDFYSYLNTRGDRIQQKLELHNKARTAHDAYSSLTESLSTIGKMAGIAAAVGGGMYGLVTGLTALTTPDFADLIRSTDGNTADLNYIRDLAREDGYDLSLEEIKKLHDEGFSDRYLKHFLKARKIKE